MSKRKISQEDSVVINSSIYNHLVASGLNDVAKSFLSASKLDKKSVSASAPDLSESLTFYKANHTNGNATKKAKVEAKKDSSDESSSDSESEDEQPTSKPTPAKASTKMDVESSDSDSSSSSDSEDEAPKPAVVSKPVVAKKTSSSSSDSDSDSSEDEKPAAKPTPVKAAAKKVESDSDSDSESSSSSEDEKPAVKNTPAKAATPAKTTPAKAAPVSTPKSENGKEFKIYVTGLPWLATEQEVKDFFTSAGNVLSAELPLGDNGKSSGTAYVKFGTREELDAALALDGQIWPGTERWLKIREGIDKPERRSFGGGEPSVKPEGCDTVFVGNLPYEVDEQAMRAVFEQAGEISSVRFASNEDGSFRGFGHVSFYNGDDVDNAIKLAGTMMGTRAIRVDYAPPRSRDGGGRGAGGGGRGRGEGRGRGDGRGGRGRGGGRSPANPLASKNKGSIVAGAGGKKMSFDE